MKSVKNLIISTESIIEILRLVPQNDTETQSLSERKVGNIPSLIRRGRGGK